jgi:heat shock protein HslJ
VSVLQPVQPSGTSNTTLTPSLTPPPVTTQGGAASNKSNDSLTSNSAASPPPEPTAQPTPPPSTTTTTTSLATADSSPQIAAPAPAPLPITSVNDLTPFATKLLDGKWYISSVGSQGPVNFKNFYFIVNSSFKRFIIYGGCNVQFFIYTLTSNQISFGTPVGTTKVCTPNNDATVTDPLFKNSAYVQASATTLTFYDSSFNPTIILVNSPAS